MISVENFTYYYPDSKIPALDNLNLSIQSGDFVLLLGPSGCGKSTLVQCFNGIIPKVAGGEVEGKIFINEKDVEQHKVYQISSEVGLVFQDPNTQIFGLTVEDDVAFGPENLGIEKNEIEKRVENSLKIVGIEQLRKRFTFSLSGGEKQRTAIAGNLAMQPGILVLDEPTSDLDPKGTREVLETIKQLNKNTGITIILIEHKIDEVLGLANRTIVMDKGKIILDGSTCDIFNSNIDQLEQIGIYSPKLIQLSKMLNVKPSYKEIVSRLISINARCGEDGKCIDISDDAPSENVSQIPSIPHLEFDDMWFGYKNDNPILKGINISINKGEFVALIGANGSGKTTMLKCLIGLLRPDKGRILLDEKDIRNTGVAELAGIVGYLFQNPDYQLFADTVHEEVAFGLKNRSSYSSDIEFKVNEALEMMELTELKERHPHSLSRGQRQRLAVASILAMEPDILVLDEPTTGQDWGHLTLFMEQIKKLNGAGKTIILITHDMGLVAKYADRTIIMQDGKIAMDGSTRDVFSRSDVLKKASIELHLLARISNDIKVADKRFPMLLNMNEFQEMINVEDR
ncbi:MAG TPA: ABC transporter ATP-binding protein [Methanosarcinaceae archaeon]|nr:ABC transporter ATP-binding protein [Methanosarcinaceae archaeon]